MASESKTGEQAQTLMVVVKNISDCSKTSYNMLGDEINSNYDLYNCTVDKLKEIVNGGSNTESLDNYVDVYVLVNNIKHKIVSKDLTDAEIEKEKKYKGHEYLPIISPQQLNTQIKECIKSFNVSFDNKYCYARPCDIGVNGRTTNYFSDNRITVKNTEFINTVCTFSARSALCYNVTTHYREYNEITKRWGDFVAVEGKKIKFKKNTTIEIYNACKMKNANSNDIVVMSLPARYIITVK